jgi:hypothetical protein
VGPNEGNRCLKYNQGRTSRRSKAIPKHEVELDFDFGLQLVRSMNTVPDEIPGPPTHKPIVIEAHRSVRIPLAAHSFCYLETGVTEKKGERER